MTSSNEVKIMVVDDEPNIVVAIEYLLKQEGYQVQCASNGNEAIDLYQQFNPHIVLLDVMMPISDGIETSKNIRDIDKHSQTHIIFLTARGTTADRKLGYTSGGDDYIVKPFKNSDLLEKIREKHM